ncbi:MAG: lysylphosphatidylglycerol synthase transmembrane domain-containing protein [Actinomycetota bacterium]
MSSPEDGLEPAPPRGGGLKLVLRLAIGAAVLGLLVLRNPGEIVHAVADARPVWVALGSVAFLAGLVVSALRWRSYLEVLELRLSVAALVRLCFVGTFFNAFLPTGVGGDAYKAVRVAKARGRGPEAFASVFLDRFAGVVALALIGLMGTATELFQRDTDLRVASLSILLSGGILLAAVVLLTAGERLLGRGWLVKHHGLGEKIRSAVRAIHGAGRHPAAAARGYLLGLVYQALMLGTHLAVARALGLKGVSAGAMAGIVVISSMATMIPVTVNGLGFREASYVWALGTFGVVAAPARAFAVLILAVLVFASAVGGLVYVVAGGEIRSDAQN